jgi:hypothetical protein
MMGHQGFPIWLRAAPILNVLFLSLLRCSGIAILGAHPKRCSAHRPLRSAAASMRGNTVRLQDGHVPVCDRVCRRL